MVLRELGIRVKYLFDKSSLNNLNTGIGKTKGKLSTLSTGLSRVFNMAMPGISNMTSAFTGLAGSTGLVVAGVAAIGLAVVKLTKDFIPYENALRGILKVNLAKGMEWEDLEGVSDKILSIAKESVFSATEVAQAAEALSQAGFDMKEVYELLPNSLNFASASYLGTAEAAKVASRIMSANGVKSVEDFMRVTDAMIGVSNSTTNSVAELGNAFGQLTSIADIAGLKLEETTALMGILGHKGSQGSKGGTLLRNLLSDFKNPDNKLSIALKKVGIDVDNIVTKEGKFRDIIGLLRTMDNLSAEQKKTLLDTFGGPSRTGKALAVYLNDYDGMLDSLMSKMESFQGLTKKSGETDFMGMSGSIRLFGSVMDTAGKKFMQDSKLDFLIEQLFRLLIDVLPPLVKIIGVVLGPIISLLSVVIEGLTPIVETIIYLFNGLSHIIEFVLSAFTFSFSNLANLIKEKITDPMRKSTKEMEQKHGELMEKWKGFWEGSFIKTTNQFIWMINQLIKAFNMIFGTEHEQLKYKTFSDYAAEKNERDKNQANALNSLINQNIVVNGAGAGTANAIADNTRGIFQLELKKLLLTTGY
jgi:TP901 family phage tail tape measure protein